MRYLFCLAHYGPRPEPPFAVASAGRNVSTPGFNTETLKKAIIHSGLPPFLSLSSARCSVRSSFHGSSRRVGGYAAPSQSQNLLIFTNNYSYFFLEIFGKVFLAKHGKLGHRSICTVRFGGSLLGGIGERSVMSISRKTWDALISAAFCDIDSSDSFSARALSARQRSSYPLSARQRSSHALSARQRSVGPLSARAITPGATLNL